MIKKILILLTGEICKKNELQRDEGEASIQVRTSSEISRQ